jgi:hypothetical protein
MVSLIEEAKPWIGASQGIVIDRRPNFWGDGGFYNFQENWV